MTHDTYACLDLLSTAIVLLDADLRIVDINSAAEDMFSLSRRSLTGQPLSRLVTAHGELGIKLRYAIAENRGFRQESISVTGGNGHGSLHVDCMATPADGETVKIALELRAMDQQLRVEREAAQLTQSQANRELIRNLAHEIKNPLGGLRGSAQLLERELDRSDLREYTQVIINEADRLQRLMERLLAPHRIPERKPVNIHEVCERVRSLVHAEFPQGINVVRDYDVSLPEIIGDREQLIQVVLNIVKNAAQAILGQPAPATRRGNIILRTRAIHQVTLAKRRYRLAFDLQIIDDGPGIPETIRDHIFYPLVSGRADGHGLGLTLATNFIEYHRGVIECDSQPGRTAFRILLPIGTDETATQREVAV
ncbi:MAG: PAS domain-containing protein [Betaproteobacteria bacterium]|nr:PAS domain-containing protein [Betaproteobacteria bacterium]